jgi:hypothetical protein
MHRRMLFPLRQCPGLVPIRELEHDAVVVDLEWDAFEDAPTMRGRLLAEHAVPRHDRR